MEFHSHQKQIGLIKRKYVLNNFFLKYFLSVLQLHISWAPWCNRSSNFTALLWASTLDTRNSSKLIPEVRKERFCSKFSRFHVNNVTESLLSTAPTKSFVRDYFWAQHKCLAQQKLSQHRLPRTRFHTQPELSRATSQLLAPPQQIVQHPPEAQLSLGSKKVKLNTKEDEF